MSVLSFSKEYSQFVPASKPLLCHAPSLRHSYLVDLLDLIARPLGGIARGDHPKREGRAVFI